jgi:mannosidase alpha-like ER degradation enhancer 2
MTMMKFILPVVILFLLGKGNPASGQGFTPEQKAEECRVIKEGMRHAWEGYKTYALGYDALKPLSKQGRNWYRTSFLMTPVDAYDTFILMGMKDEAREAKGLILSKLNFDADEEVQLFEVSIRLLGGLLSSYEMDGDTGFLRLAVDLGHRLLPAFNSPTGMPWRYVNLKTGKTRDPLSNPAEIGTYLMEFGKLTQYTGDSAYYKAAKRASLEVCNRRSTIDLVGTIIDVRTGEWKNTESQIGARIDSYYEYLYKAFLLFGDQDLLRTWIISKNAIQTQLMRNTRNGIFLTRVEMSSGKETRPYYGALDAFYAGLLALSGDVYLASKVQQANYYMWTRFGIEPEEYNFRTDSIIWPSYPLRPENIESCFYLYRMTGDQKYLLMGQKMTGDILSKCRTEAGFAQVKNVTTMELEDDMESFFLAETLKYAYLLFAPETTLDLRKVVFNTEAHPLKRVVLTP